MDELFDDTLFEKLLGKYKTGLLCKDNNIINGKIEMPDAIINFYPEKNSKFYNECLAAGEKSISSGELAVFIVNGGMATRFGSHVKGVVEVFDDKSFLQLKTENIKLISENLKKKIHIYIMNSIFTDELTKELFEKKNYFNYDGNYIHFANQFYFKRIDKTGNIIDDESSIKYGSGHGDFFYVVKKFFPEIMINARYLFFSNVDNLGATLDPVILGYHIIKKKDITVEIAEKYQGDKGGTPAIVGGKPQIVEEFKFPKSFNQDSIRYFNTATYIYSTEMFKKNVELPFYLVEKKVDDNEVIQFERLAGDLTQFFNANYLVIDRKERFFPIKTPDDLDNSRAALKDLLKDKISK